VSNTRNGYTDLDRLARRASAPQGFHIDAVRRECKCCGIEHRREDLRGSVDTGYTCPACSRGDCEYWGERHA
jgi:hypothetical protein